MSANLFGLNFRIMSFGESHGPGLGVVIDGCPSGLAFDEDFLKAELKRRRPGRWTDDQIAVSSRQEADAAEVLSGVFQGKTLGTPIAMICRNTDARSQDYEDLAKSPRVGHADDTWKIKFDHVDPRGGGRSSGRETWSRVAAGAVAKMLIRSMIPKISMRAYVSSLGPISLSKEEEVLFLQSQSSADQWPGRFPSRARNDELKNLLREAQGAGESFGGIAKMEITGLPSGLGQPVFHKIKSDLGAAMMSIGAVNGFELGSGFSLAQEAGTTYHRQQAQSVYGGARGGISTGEPIHFSVSVKPTSSILEVAKKGRHDPAILIRAIPVIEAMAALVIADHLLWSRKDKLLP